MSRTELTAAVDRIESEWAVLRVADVGEWLLPLAMLPGEPREGMHLRVLLEPDARADEQVRDRVAQLQQNLLRAADEEGRS